MAKPSPVLDKKTIGAFRDFASSGLLMEGLEFLRRHHAPKVHADEVEKMMHQAIELKGYLAALEDVENILTTLPAREPSEKPDSLEP